MVVNIYDTANEMSRQLVETQEFLGLKKAFNELKEDKEAFESFKKFQTMQATAQRKQMQGQNPTDDEIKAIQTLAKEISGKKAVQNLMNNERQVDQMLQQLNKTITSPLQDLYSDIMPQGPEDK
ncbi:YlbF family regulator [Limosilactobacillus kribbianus]|uniref:YlbF family regulator n=1 Tax=Limosilactobacillus kribbianus TaxID=2982695 RepID=UPI0022641B80|nr:YlbF family regulator [Limosilactobacillus kribbianus]